MGQLYLLLGKWNYIWLNNPRVLCLQSLKAEAYKQREKVSGQVNDNFCFTFNHWCCWNSLTNMPWTCHTLTHSWYTQLILWVSYKHALYALSGEKIVKFSVHLNHPSTMGEIMLRTGKEFGYHKENVCVTCPNLPKMGIRTGTMKSLGRTLKFISRLDSGLYESVQLQYITWIRWTLLLCFVVICYQCSRWNHIIHLPISFRVIVKSLI